MNRHTAIVAFCLASMFTMIAGLGFAQESESAAPSHTLIIKKVLQSVSGEHDEIKYEMSVGVEPGREFYTKANIGGTGVTLHGTLKASQNEQYRVSINIAETVKRGTMTGPDGQTQSVSDQRELHVNLVMALDQDVTAGGTQIVGEASQDRPVEAIVVRLEKVGSPISIKKSEEVEFLSYEWKPNEEAPRKSGLRLMPGKTPPQYVIAYRTEKLEGSGNPSIDMAPRLVAIQNQKAQIKILGPVEMITIESQILKEDGEMLEFHTTLSRQKQEKSTNPAYIPAPSEKTKTVSEKLEREMTLKLGEEKEVGKFMGAKMFVTVTRVENPPAAK